MKRVYAALFAVSLLAFPAIAHAEEAVQPATSAIIVEDEAVTTDDGFLTEEGLGPVSASVTDDGEETTPDSVYNVDDGADFESSDDAIDAGTSDLDDTADSDTAADGNDAADMGLEGDADDAADFEDGDESNLGDDLETVDELGLAADPSGTASDLDSEGAESAADEEHDTDALTDEEGTGTEEGTPDDEELDDSGEDGVPSEEDESSTGVLEPLSPAPKGTWKGSGSSRRYILKSTGKALKDGVYEIDGEQYCFDPKGRLVTGWVAIDGEVYYFDPETGAMATSCIMVIKGLCAPLLTADGSTFSDVSKRTPHSSDITWLYENGITTGWVSDNGTRTFRPMSTLARADMAAFLYRLAGSPDFVAERADTGRFTDVTPDTPHANEIWWLARTGISEGWAESNGTYTFRPMDNLARADMAAFLYRLAGSPKYKATEEEIAYFSDVTRKTPHAREIRWLASVGVTEGFGSGSTRTFRPYDTVRRQDMAAFMHRMVANEVIEPSAEHVYRFAADGHVITGWYRDSFYDLTTGARVDAGWVKNDTKWRYISPRTGETLKGGPHTIAGYKYMFTDTGLLRHGWIEVDGSNRYFSRTSGAMYKNGIYKIGRARYCFANDGTIRHGLVKVNGSSYYFDPSTGKMLYGFRTINGTRYYFDRVTGKRFTSGNAQLDRFIFEMIDRFGDNGAASLHRVYDWVSTFTYMGMNLYPSGSWENWSVQYAREMYINRTGNCHRYASLTCWFARAMGYDAKVVAGQVHSAVSYRWVAHGWVEINTNSGHVIIDTSQHRRGTGEDFFLVSYPDAPLSYRYRLYVNGRHIGVRCT